MNSLREQLLELQKESKCSREHKPFYSPHRVRAFLTPDRVNELISLIPSLHGNPRDANRYSSLIYETSLTIFAVLLLNGHDHHILDFLYRRETDSRLTYTLDALYFLPPGVAREFVNRQWQLHPVILIEGEIHRELEPRDILPFLDDREVAYGGFGTVFKVRLESTCQKLVAPLGEVNVARKELRVKQTGFDERAILDMLETLQHPNIIKFLGSYTQHGVENLLFPYVSMDLAQLFKTDRKIDAHDIYLGMHGIADALNRIHHFSLEDGNVQLSRVGYHHDLWPRNILVHRNVFLLSDFGLSKLKADDQDSKSKLKGGHDDYLGPEAFHEIDWTNGNVGRAMDIWSLGCVLAEVATFIERRSIAEFREKRQTTYGSDITITDSAFHLGGRVRPAVTEWLTALTLQPSDQQVPALINLIEEMLNPNPYKRIKITEVTEKLALLAIVSNVQAINKAFRILSNSSTARLNRFVVQIFLERTKFESWERVFCSLHDHEKLQSISTLFECISKLLNVLQSVNVQSDEIERESDSIMSKIWTANDLLCYSLPRDWHRKLQDFWTRKICEVQDTEKLAAIRSVAELDRYRLVGVSVAMRYMSQIINNSIISGSRSRYIDAGCVDIDEKLPTDLYGAQNLHLIEDRARTMGYLNGSSRVMIEWKEYDARWQGDHGDKLFATMDALVNLLDPNVTPREGVAKERVLACRGYFHELRNFRFGFVYSLNPSSANDVDLFSVNNIIRMTNPDIPELVNTLRPDLGDIFTLAKDLSASLHIFHKAGWVHKNMSSHHLLVFSPSPDLVHRYVASAVLAGLNDSRPEASGYTLGPRQEFQHYQHPLYQQNVEFRQSFDYFGLGIVLLELGLWRPISVLRSDHPEISSAEDFRIKLLKSYVPQLGERMGAVYRDAVDFCLDAEKKSNENLQNIQGLFESKVVEPLSSCFA